MRHKRASVAVALSAIFLVIIGASSAQSDEPRVGGYTHKTTLVEMFGEDFSDGVAADLRRDFEIEFQIFVPEAYDPQNPPGVLVYIAPSKSGQPGRDWDRVLAEKNLIWVSVNKSGNYKDSIQRILEALASLEYAKRNYQIDHSRKFLTGFSGGAKTASHLDQLYPGWFDGAIYIAGAFQPEFIQPENFDAAKSKPYVFLAGDQDSVLQRFKKAFRAYQKAGFEKLKFMEIRNLTHRLPAHYDMRDALAYLDENISAPNN